ncbi:MAG: hypothetical protein ACYC6R_14260 [Anaerolineales bacterium]
MHILRIIHKTIYYFVAVVACPTVCDIFPAGNIVPVGNACWWADMDKAHYVGNRSRQKQLNLSERITPVKCSLWWAADSIRNPASNSYYLSSDIFDRTILVDNFRLL